MTATPVPRTWTAGEIVTAGNMNAGIRDVLTFLMAPPIARCRQTVAQSQANNVSTSITLDTEDVDSSGMHSTSVNTNRFTAVYPGWYEGYGNFTWVANATGIRVISWNTNGGAINGSGDLFIGNAGATNRLASAGVLIFLNAGDWMEMLPFQNSGGAINSSVSGSEQPTVQVKWISN